MIEKNDLDQYIKYAMSKGLIDLDKIVSDVNDSKREEVISLHKYSIWQGKNGKWYTYLPDPVRDVKGKLVKRTSRERLEEALIKYYEQEITLPTFGECFRMQQEYMLTHYKITVSTYDRKNIDYSRHIEGTDFDKTPIDMIRERDIIMFLDNLLSYNNRKMTQKALGNVKSLIGNVFKYAKVIKEYDCVYTRELLAAYQPSFRQLRKKSNTLEVFNDQETDMIIDRIIEVYAGSIRHMGLLFMLFTGLRVGELATLKVTDFIPEDRLHVQRTLAKEKDEHGRSHVVIHEYAKTEESEKVVLLSDDAIEVLEHIKKLREAAGEPSEWFMAENGNFIAVSKFDKCIRKLCEELRIPIRSCHKLRKTYCSELLDLGVNEKVVQEQMRHTDIRTTQTHYNYCIKTEMEKRKEINKFRKLGERHIGDIG